MKANGEKRKIFNDAVDLLNGAEDTSAPEGGIQMLPIESIRPFRKHPFRLYEGERRMFHEEDVQMLDKSYFNIVMMGDYDVTIQSKNTGHL